MSNQANIQHQLKAQFAHLGETATGVLSPAQMKALQKAYGFSDKPRHISERQRQANIEMFNKNLQAEAKTLGEAFVQNTQNKPIEQQYVAYQDALNALKKNYSNLSEEQQNLALTSFSEVADVFKKADQNAGFFARTGDALSYIPSTAANFGEQLAGLFSPDGETRQWFKEAKESVEDWRSDEAKLRAFIAAEKMAEAKAKGETGFTQFFANAAENTIETLGQFTESALPTVGAAVVGTAAAPITGGASLSLPFIVGGVQSAGSARNDIYDNIMAMPQAQLAQTPEYQALLQQGLTAEQARRTLASSFIEHGGEVIATGLSGAALNALGGLGRIGQVGKGILGSSAGKFASELLTEPTDEVFQQLMVNKAVNDFNPNHSLTNGLGEAAAGGLLFGTAGGAIAAADNAYRQPSAEQVKQEQDALIDGLQSADPNPSQPSPQSQENVQNDVQQAVNPEQNVAKTETEAETVEPITPDAVATETKSDETSPEDDLDPVEYEDLSHLPDFEHNHERIWKGKKNGNPFRSEQEAEMSDVFKKAEEYRLNPTVVNKDGAFLVEVDKYDENIRLSRSAMKSVEANITRGRERMTKAILDKADVKRGMYNHEFGWVDFVWGDDGTTKSLGRNGEPRGRGISHIFEARERKDGQSYQQTSQMLINNIVETIAKGTVKSRTPSRLALEYKAPNEQNGHKVLLTKNKGNNAWVLSGYEIDPLKGRKGEKVQAGRDTSTPTSTHIDPTHPRTDMGASLMASDSGQLANANGLSNDTAFELGRPTSTSQLNDTHAHSQRGRGVVAENGANLADNSPSVNPQTLQDQQALSRLLGEEIARHIEVVDRNTVTPPKGETIESLQNVEGWYDKATQKTYIYADGITADFGLTREERLAWVTWHELAHKGLDVKYRNVLNAALQQAKSHSVVATISRFIQQSNPDYTENVAIEEALVELYSAYRTGNWDSLNQRYNTSIHPSYAVNGKNDMGSVFQRFVAIMRRLIAGLSKNKRAEMMAEKDLFNLLKGIDNSVMELANSNPTANAQGQGDVRYSLNENADSDFAKAVDDFIEGNQVATSISMGTTPDILKMIGLPDVEVKIQRKTLGKIMRGKHAIEPETLKQLPSQLNDPVGVFKSAPHSSNPDGYVVLTELTEFNSENNRDEPIIAALHLDKSGEVQLIEIASAYGKNHQGLQNILNKDKAYYWNKEKGSQLANVHWLQLPLKLRSEANLSENNIKTETDLSQYQDENSTNDDLSEQAYNQAKAEGKTELTFQQWKQVRSPEFKAWFGDWENDPANASKVVNEKTGEPLVVYHGTNADFTIFDKDKQKNNRNQYGGGGFYFTSNPDVANLFGDKSMPVFLNARVGIQDKILARRKGQNIEADHLRPTDNRDIWIIYNPNQIKSATDNNGEFSSSNDDIRFSRRPKSESLEKLRKAETIRISGKDIEPSSDLREYKRNALNYGKTLRGTYVNKDTGQEISLGLAAVKEVLNHDYKDPDHLQSVAAIPQIIEDAIYIDTVQNEDVEKHPHIESYDYYLAGLNIGGDDYTVRAVVANANTGERYYDHKLTEIEKGDLLSTAGITTPSFDNQSPSEKGDLRSLPSRITNPVGESLSPLSEINDKRLLQILQDENLGNDDGDNVRYSRKQSVADLAKTGKAKAEPTVFDDIKARDYQGFKQRLNKAIGKLDEWVADGLRPVNDWIDSFKSAGISAHEAERLKDDMYRAKGVRDAFNSELEQAYAKPLIKQVAKIAKANKLDELSAKRLIGYWVSGRYAIEKNNALLKAEYQAMLDAEQALNDATKKGDTEAIESASREYRQAERQYRYRKHDVELALGANDDFKVGTAGGWSNAEAVDFMQNIEKHIPRKQLEEAAELLYDLNQRRLEIDHQAGRYTEEQYNAFKANRHYVPLTGNPYTRNENGDDGDWINGAGQNAINVSKDRALKGRKLSEAEDGIDASWRAMTNSTTYAGWVDFKNRIDTLYEGNVAELVAKGYSERSAREETEKTLGISKAKLQGLTRSSDDVLIRKVGGVYYEYRLPKNVMTALKNDNVEHANAFLTPLSKPTSWYARGVTQWKITFAPMNMMRDTWEKSEFIRVQKLYDKNGKQLDDKTMDKIGRAVLKNAFLHKDIWTATKRLGFNQPLRDSVEAERLLKEVLALGGVSNYSTYFAKTETDLVKTVKAENSILGKKLEQAGELLSSYNKVFDTVSALSAYKAMIDNGIDPKQAAAKTLELTNFRKTGAKMKGIKALYMFSQPTAMGARNLIKYLSTPKGRHRFIGYMAVMIPLYLALRAMDDDDEGGNVMDQLGDITRYIPLPLGLGKYLKIPVGFGMPQMAWNFSVNIVKAGVSDMSFTEAATNMFVHSMKTFAPISPSEISAAKFPLEKLALTATPTILQPLAQNLLNRSAFGNQITTNFVRDDKLKAEQSKSTTAQFWKDVAIEVQETLGIDMYPEQIKNLFDGYGSMLGSLKELQTVFVENPNREKLGRQTRTPFLNQFIGTKNEFAIQSRYYEASEEAQKLNNEYQSRKERGTLDGWLTAEKMQMVQWHEFNDKRMKQLRSQKGNDTKALRKGTMSPAVYENRLQVYNKQMDVVQRQLLKRWREMQGLNTH